MSNRTNTIFYKTHDLGRYVLVGQYFTLLFDPRGKLIPYLVNSWREYCLLLSRVRRFDSPVSACAASASGATLLIMFSICPLCRELVELVFHCS